MKTKYLILLAFASILAGCSVVELKLDTVENGCSGQTAGAWCDPLSAKAQVLQYGR